MKMHVFLSVFIASLTLCTATYSQDSAINSPKLNIKVYPNPLTDMIYLEMDDPPKTNFDVELINEYDEVIFKLTTDGQKILRIKCHNIPPGDYEIRYQDQSDASIFGIVEFEHSSEE